MRKYKYTKPMIRDWAAYASIYHMRQYSWGPMYSQPHRSFWFCTRI